MSKPAGTGRRNILIRVGLVLPLLAALAWAPQASAARTPGFCPVLTDPAGDVQNLNGDHFDDPTRDLTRLHVRLADRTLEFEVGLVDLQAHPYLSLGDMVGFGFYLGDHQFMVEAIRRLAPTGTPGNRDYAYDFANKTLQVTATWDPNADRVRFTLDRAQVQRIAKHPLRPGTTLQTLYAFATPADTDDGTPLWGDFAGEETRSDGHPTDVRLRRC